MTSWGTPRSPQKHSSSSSRFGSTKPSAGPCPGSLGSPNFYAGFFEHISPEQFRAQMETNFFGPTNVTRAVLPVMRKQRWSRVITITPAAGLIGQEFCAAPASRDGTPGNSPKPWLPSPLRFVAGADVMANVEQKLATIQSQIDSHRELSASLSYDS
ncbi:hypothetical protein ABIB35_000958 [Arthrobacter sp. UYP6]|uniref:SDR family NAD(P)-dependent oxidoreductase n=1 Tax=Arthrobacter sp. UYP6 TaxID=1756378 RepID=UPI0033918F79